MDMPLKDIVNIYVPNSNAYQNIKTDTLNDDMLAITKKHIHNFVSPVKKDDSQSICLRSSSPKVYAGTLIPSQELAAWKIGTSNESELLEEFQNTEDDFETFIKGLDSDNEKGDNMYLSPVKHPVDSLDDTAEDLIDYTLEEEITKLEATLRELEADIEDETVQEFADRVISSSNILNCSIERNVLTLETIEPTSNNGSSIHISEKFNNVAHGIQLVESDSRETKSDDWSGCIDISSVKKLKSNQSNVNNIVGSVSNVANDNIDVESNSLIKSRTGSTGNTIVSCKAITDCSSNIVNNSDNCLLLKKPVENSKVDLINLSNYCRTTQSVDFLDITNVESDNDSPTIVYMTDHTSVKKDLINSSKGSFVNNECPLLVDESQIVTIEKSNEVNNYTIIDLTDSPRSSSLKNETDTNKLDSADITLKTDLVHSLSTPVQNASTIKSTFGSGTNSSKDHQYKIDFDTIKDIENSSPALNTNLDSKSGSGTPYCLDDILKVWKPKTVPLNESFYVLDECGEVSDHEMPNHINAPIISHSLQSVSTTKSVIPEDNSGIDKKLPPVKVSQEGTSQELLNEINLLNGDDDDDDVVDGEYLRIFENDDLNDDGNENKGEDKSSVVLIEQDVECLKKENINISEHKEISSPVLIKKPISVVKPESEDYVSNDPQENADNNNPEWEILRKLQTDEERYRAVRARWRNLNIPDPNKNLTYRHRGSRQGNLKPSTTTSGNNVCNVFKPLCVTTQQGGSRKRALTEESVVLNRKRPRNQSCTTIFDRKVEELQKNMEEEKIRLSDAQRIALLQLSCEQRQEHNQLRHYNISQYDYNILMVQLTSKQFQDVDRLHQQFAGARNAAEESTRNQLYVLRKAMEEVKIFHSFYQGLDAKDNKDSLLLNELELEDLLEEDKLYNEYNNLYH